MFSPLSPLSPISSLPHAELFLPPAVQHLDRSHTSLTTVPPDRIRISNSQLKALNLSGNSLEILPNNFQAIYLLTRSSKELELLTELEELIISKNNLSVIPENIKSLQRLRILNLSSNSLTSLPSGLVLLSSLQMLSLNNLYLTELPEDLG